MLFLFPIYLLTSLKAPKQLLKDIDRARRQFLWSGDSEISGGKCKVAWPYVTMPTEFGGLGILNLERFSRALRLRWLWFSWSSPDRPWKDLPLPVDSVDTALFNAATKVIVHNGRKASFWNSSWLDGRTPASVFPGLYKHSRRKNRSVRDALMGQRWVRDIAHNLNHDLLHEFFTHWTAIWEAHIDL